MKASAEEWTTVPNIFLGCVGCAAKITKGEIVEKHFSGQTNNILAAPHQNIGGVLVAPNLPNQTFPVKENKPQILQKAALPATDPIIALAPIVELSDQAVGVSKTNTNAFTSRHTATMSQTRAATSDANKMRLSQSGILCALHMIREPVVDYQESRGVPRNEEITFLTLVTSLCTQAYTAAITILVMLWNLMPLVDGLVYFIRFLLDKTIDIVQTQDNKDRAIKGAILFGEMTIITFIIFMIVGLIFMPVYVLMARLFSKIFSMIAW